MVKRKFVFFAAIALLVLLGCFIWPTPYRYFVLPGTPPMVLRINRFTGRVWRLRMGDLDWFNPAEYDEIAARSSDEIKRRCHKAEMEGAFQDPQNRRVIELRGYTFSCP